MTQMRQPALRIRDRVELERIAARLRLDVVQMIAPLGQGYLQQGLGAADLFAFVFFSELRLDPADPQWPDRDRFILSTAHNTAILYATLAARSIIPPAWLENYCQDGSPLEINASERLGAAVEATCGSLGQGLSVGAGMALHAKRKGTGSRIYVLLGDGEMQEGQVWEAAMCAAANGLGNLCLILDLNYMQVEGKMAGPLGMEPVGEKWASFGFKVLDVDGHDFDALALAFDNARAITDRPTCIIARTLVGKGVPELEGIFGHNMRLPGALADSAIQHLRETIDG